MLPQSKWLAVGPGWLSIQPPATLRRHPRTVHRGASPAPGLAPVAQFTNSPDNDHPSPLTSTFPPFADVRPSGRPGREPLTTLLATSRSPAVGSVCIGANQ